MINKRKFNNSISIIFFVCLTFVSSNLFAQDNGSEQKVLSQEAFEKSIGNLVPLSPGQIKEYKKRLKETDRAVHKKKKLPEMNTKTRRLSLEPGGKPPVLKIAPGYVTSVAFFDSTGQPWPLSSVTIGNPKYYNVKKPQNLEPGNMITIVALKEYVDSNIVLTLQNHDMPVSVQLKTVPGESSQTDALIAFQADKYGPKAKEPTVGPGLKTTVSDTMLSFLDGVSPPKAQYLSLKPNFSSVDLWKMGKSMFLRTKYPMMWPAWTSVTNGVGGMKVYKIPQVQSFILSKDGEMVTVEVNNG